MYGTAYEPPAIEKVRKAQWTVENTRATQAVVNGLISTRDALKRVDGSPQVIYALDVAIQRFKVLDPNVNISVQK